MHAHFLIVYSCPAVHLHCLIVYSTLMQSLCNACGIRFKKEERRAAETGVHAGAGAGAGCGFYGAQRAHGSAASAAPPAASYAEEPQPCGDPNAPFLAWRLSAVPPAPAFSVWPERATMYQYN
jgi:hypothetical protein